MKQVEKKVAGNQKKSDSDNNSDISIEKSKLSSDLLWQAILLVFLFFVTFLYTKNSLDPNQAYRFIFFSFFLMTSAFFLIFKKAFFTKLKISHPINIFLLFGLSWLLWASISVSKSINPFEGYYELAKMGLWIIFVYILAQQTSRSSNLVINICRTITLLLLAHAFIGISQFYGLNFIGIPGTEPFPYGMMANRNLFGASLVLMLPFATYVFFKDSLFWRVFSIIATTITIFALILAQTRSAWIGAAIVFATIIILTAIFAKPFNKKWLFWFIAIPIIAFLSLKGAILTDFNGDFKNEVTGRISSIVGDTSNVMAKSSVNDRISIWKKTLPMVKDHSLIGVGPGNWKLRVLEYGSDGTSWQHGLYLPDRVHNIFLQKAAETGVTGLILFTLMFGVSVWCGLSILLKNSDSWKKILIICMLGGLIGFLIDCLLSFGFERIEYMVLVGLICGIMLGQYTTSNNNLPYSSPQFKKRLLWAFVIFFVTIFSVFLGYKKDNFNKSFLLAKHYYSQSNYNKLIDVVDEGRSIWANTAEDGRTLELYSSLAYLNKNSYDDAKKEAFTALKYNPISPLVFNNLGTIYTSIQRFDSAMFYYKKAFNIKPENIETQKNIAVCYFNLKQYDSCIAKIESFGLKSDEFFIKLESDARMLSRNTTK